MAIHGFCDAGPDTVKRSSPQLPVHAGVRSRRVSTGAGVSGFVRRTALLICLLLSAGGASAVAATPANASCPTVTYNRVAYCVGTIADLKAGKYPAGMKIALEPVAVLSRSGTTASLGQATAAFTSEPCPPGMFCGALITCTNSWQTLTVDFARLGPRPAAGSAIKVYGQVTTTPTLAPAGWALVGTDYQKNGNFYPCALQ